MKAKEYYEKYKAGLISSDEKDYMPALNGMLHDMTCDIQAMLKSRHTMRPSSIAAVVKEMNQRYNAVSSMFTKEYGMSPLKRDGFLAYWKAVTPEYPWVNAYL